MKNEIHPEYNEKAKVICDCGNEFTIGSTESEIHVEVCHKCHPFYTGKKKVVDAAGRVEKFKQRMKKAQNSEENNSDSDKKEEEEEEENDEEEKEEENEN